MQRDWDERARENARYYVATGNTDWSDEEFFASGEQAMVVILTLMSASIFAEAKIPRTCGFWRLAAALGG